MSLPEGFIKVGSVCVDTATLLICDPAYLDIASEFADEGAFADKEGYDENGVAQLEVESVAGPVALAFSPTGFGDGMYDVLARYEGGRVAEIRMVFMPHPQFPKLTI